MYDYSFFTDDKKSRKVKDDGDAALLQSNIWTTLFRGGYTNNGKLQRSLSGHHVCSLFICYVKVLNLYVKGKLLATFLLNCPPTIPQI